MFLVKFSGYSLTFFQLLYFCYKNAWQHENINNLDLSILVAVSVSKFNAVWFTWGCDATAEGWMLHLLYLYE
jgi:hypothetical protein